MLQSETVHVKDQERAPCKKSTAYATTKFIRYRNICEIDFFVEIA
jgi:hypothetical protein